MRKIIAVLAAAMLAMPVSCGKSDDKKDDKSRYFVIEDNVLVGYTGKDAIVHIPDGVTEINQRAFWGNNTAVAVYIPSSVRKLDENAFWSCNGLRFVDIAEGTETISECVFWSCPALKDVNLPESVKYMDDSVFWAIRGLTLHAPENSYAAGFAKDHRFSLDYTPAVYEDEAPGKHITASQYADMDLTEFEIGSDIAAIDANAFYHCEGPAAVTVPENVQYIAPDAFGYCTGLKTAEIQGCRDVRANAFEYCKGLEKLTIGEGTVSIGSWAFSYCENLKDVFLPESLSELGEYAFEHCSDDLVLHVPAGSEAEKLAKLAGLDYDNNI